MENKFNYNGGHMQQHAVKFMGLGAMNALQLSNTVNKALGVNMMYGPQLAGGVNTSPAEYAKFLRATMTRLTIGKHLGEYPVCTNPRNCPDATYSPMPGLSWHYSIGHWVEDDPTYGDGAFSSPGAFGFYPWIDKTKTNYGIVARSVPNGAYESIACGQAIRKAYYSGVAKP